MSRRYNPPQQRSLEVTRLITDPASGRRLRFGPFLLDPRTGEVRKGRSVVRLPPQPTRVLALLASRAHQLVTREEVRDAIWGGETHVEFDQAINFCVRKIRVALGDDAESPRYIETLARRGYRFIAPVQAEGDPPPGPAPIIPAGAPAEERVMLAVLPFENLSGDPDQEYFGDGLTEEMITHLGRLGPRRLGVIARTSSMRYKGAARSVGDISRELGVQYVLEGSVRISRGRVRVSAQLIHAEDQTHVWTESYDRPLRNILALQADVAKCIAREIRLELAPGTGARAGRSRAVVPEAYQSYLRGLVYMNQGSLEACKNSRICFEHALKADPGFAPCHAAQSLNWARMGFHGLLVPREAWRRAGKSARRAIEIDDECADGHAALGRVHLEFDWDWEGAGRELRRAIQLNPNHIPAHHWLSHLYVALRRPEDSLLTSRRAVDLDPFDPWIHSHLCWHYINARQFEEAIAHSRKTLLLDPNCVQSRIHLGWALLETGRHREAVEALDDAASTIRGQDNEALWSLGHACAVSGDARRARRILRDLAVRRCRSSFARVLIHLGLGDVEETLRGLELALEERCVQMIYLRQDPRFDPLRSNPRFEELLGRIGLPD